MEQNKNGLLRGKVGLINGIANNMSISWAIAQIAKAHGADLAFTYQGKILEKRIKPLAEEIGCDFLEQCDVTSKESMDKLFKALEKRKGKLDFLVHSLVSLIRTSYGGGILIPALKISLTQ